MISVDEAARFVDDFFISFSHFQRKMVF